MNTTVLLVRHGEVTSVNDDGEKVVYDSTVSLSDEGRDEIFRLSEELKSKGFIPERIYTSPFRRTVESANIIRGSFGLSRARKVSDLRDVEAPEWRGRLYADLMAIGGNVYEGHPGRLLELMERASKAFRLIVEENEGKTIAVVSHGDTIKMIHHWLTEGEASLPDPATMRRENYLQKGQAWRLVITPELRLLESEVMGKEREGGGIERKF